MSSGKLTTHVLNTAHGCPGAGIDVALYRLKDGQRILLAEMRTNSDGRTNGPILEGEQFETGQYELLFQAGAYFADRGAASADDVRFLDDIPIRFGITDASQHYHVPLLVSPYSYSTYRGS